MSKIQSTSEQKQDTKISFKLNIIKSTNSIHQGFSSVGSEVDRWTTETIIRTYLCGKSKS